jgi:SAM-dependent methyltransferase
MIDIQVQMSERAIELLALLDGEPHFLLDLGCGSGLSGSVLEDQGHTWVGIDISCAMLGEFHLGYGLIIHSMRYEFYVCAEIKSRWLSSGMLHHVVW